MKLKKTGIWILVLMLATNVLGQPKHKTSKSREELQQIPGGSTQSLIKGKTQRIEASEYAGIFRSVQQGIADGNVKTFSNYLGSQVFVSLPTGENGHYSANQAYYILQNYFGSRQIQSFRFSTYGESNTAPYATGAGHFEARGNSETVQIYASLSRLNDKWVLGQLSIY